MYSKHNKEQTHLTRNLNYDLLRLLGLLIIVIAHSNPPEWLFQLRNFGTPLLVLGSGLTYALIYSHRTLNIRSFYPKRIKNLLLPVWLFLTLFFVGYYLFSQLIDSEFPFTLRKVIGSYALMGGIGFVWVFKVYLALALLTPLALYLNRRISSNNAYFAALLLAYLGYELMVSVYSDSVGSIINSLVFTFIPYGLIYCYAFRLPYLSNQQVLSTALLSMLFFVLYALFKFNETGSFVTTQGYKYPPTFYYLSYAFFAINIIYLLVKSCSLKSLQTQRVIIWLSSNSMWLYLWHILALFVWSGLLGTPDGSMLPFLQKALFVIGFAVLCVHIQNKLNLPSTSQLFNRFFAQTAT